VTLGDGFYRFQESSLRGSCLGRAVLLPGRMSLFPSDLIGRMVDVSTDSTRMSALGFGG